MESESRSERDEPATHALEASPRHALASVSTLEMEEPPGLRAYWRILRKRRWTVFTLLFVLFTLVLIGTLNQKPIYQATALLEIQKEDRGLFTLQELFELENASDTYLETQYKLLRSSGLAQRVIRQLQLYRRPEFNPPRAWLWPRRTESRPAAQVFAVSAAGELSREDSLRTLEHFLDRLDVKPVKRSRLVEISFESEAPEVAAQVANTLAAQFIEQSLEARWEATQKASEWLSQQLTGLKARLEKSEDELQTYARQNNLLFLESMKGSAENIVNQRLRQLQEELTRAQAVRYEKESLYRLVQAGEYGSLPGVFENKLMQDLTIRLAELKREQAELATTFTSEYPRVRQIQNQIGEIQAVLAAERERAAGRIANEYFAAVRQEALLQQAFAEQQKQASEIAERSVQYKILEREVDANRQLYEGLLQRLKEAGVSAGVRASNIRIVDPAEPPQEPARPKLWLNLSLGLILGLVLGSSAAFLQEHLDNTLKTATDVERFLRLPVLALIPAVDSLNHNRRHRLPAHTRWDRLLAGGANDRGRQHAGTGSALAPAPWIRIDQDGQGHSALSEAFRSLRTSILLSSAERPPRSLLVSSAQEAEGKTTVSLNLAISLAQLSKKVLLIDADLRRPNLHRALEIQSREGLSTYLTGQQDWRPLVQPTKVGGLDIIACGHVPPNPAELLASERMRVLVRDSLADYDFLVLDSAPLLNVADSRILVSLVEGVILVVKGGAAPRELVQRAHCHARDVGGNLIGVVLNHWDVRSEDYSYYGYHQEYD